MCRSSIKSQVWTTVKSKSNWTIFNLRLISLSIESHQKTCLVSWHFFERTLYIIDHYLPLHDIFIYTGCWFRPPNVLSVKKENYLCVCGGGVLFPPQGEKQTVCLSFDPTPFPSVRHIGLFIKALNQFMHLTPSTDNALVHTSHFIKGLPWVYIRVDRRRSTCGKNNNTTAVNSLRGSQERLQ